MFIQAGNLYEALKSINFEVYIAKAVSWPDISTFRDRGASFQPKLEVEKILKNVAQPWLNDDENFGYHSSLRGLKYVVSI